MKPRLLAFLCDPVDSSELELVTPILENGEIVSGMLVSASGRQYPIIEGVPRFCSVTTSVDSFGDEWNHFNYDLFKLNWENHVVKNNFGSTEFFRGKTIVDCGAGSGMQAKWMAEAGAKHVIALELSHSVDGVMKQNLEGISNVDIIQCSIDAPPIKSGSIDGLVICHNVIQHTPNVERTARELWRILGSGEFVFNCYLKYQDRFIWMVRWLLIYRPLRGILSRCSFEITLGYAKFMAMLRFVPGLGTILEKAQMVIRGDVPPGPSYRRRLYINTVLNTFDWYGSHSFQHQKTPDEIRHLVNELQPNTSMIKNLEEYCRVPLPPGLAVRVFKKLDGNG